MSKISEIDKQARIDQILKLIELNKYIIKLL